MYQSLPLHPTLETWSLNLDIEKLWDSCVEQIQPIVGRYQFPDIFPFFFRHAFFYYQYTWISSSFSSVNLSLSLRSSLTFLVSMVEKAFTILIKISIIACCLSLINANIEILTAIELIIKEIFLSHSYALYKTS